MKKAILFFCFAVLIIVAQATPLSGTYTINPAGAATTTNFKNFTSAITYISSTNTRTDGGPANTGTVGVNGAVVFNVAAGTYNEQITFNGQITGTTATNTVSFKGAGTQATILASSHTSTAQGTLSLQQSSVTPKHLKFSGIQFLSNSTGSTVYSNGADFISFDSCHFRNLNANALYLIYSIGTSTNDSIRNCVFTNANYGFYNASGTFNNCVLLNNVFNNQSVSSIFFNSNHSALKVYNNIINMLPSNSNSSGIRVAAFANGLEIVNNKVYKMQNGSGIAIGGTGVYTTNELKLSNNTVVMEGNATTAPTGLFGISLANYTGYNVHHNTVTINNTHPNSAALYWSYVLNDNVRNNIFQNFGGGLAIAFDGYGGGLDKLSHNNYYSTGDIARYSTSRYSTAASWIATFSAIAPIKNLPVTLSSNGYQHNNGCIASSVIVSPTTDVVGTTRSAINPTMGAYEALNLNNNALMDSLVMLNAPIAFGNNSIIFKLRNIGANTINSFSASYQLNGASPVTQIFNNALNSCDTVRFSFSTLGNFINGSNTLKVYVNNVNGVSDSDLLSDTISTTILTSLIGDYTINPSNPASATNFTSFGNAISELRSRGVAGNVNFNISAGSYNELLHFRPYKGMSNTRLVTFKPSTGISVSSVIIAHSPTSLNTTPAVTLDTVIGIVFKNITFNYAINGNSASNKRCFAANRSSNITVDSCILKDIFTTASTCTTFHSIFSRNMSFTNNLIHNQQTAFFLDVDSNTTIRNNRIIKSSYTAMNIARYFELNILNNYIDSTIVYGIHLRPGSSNVGLCNFSNNIIVRTHGNSQRLASSPAFYSEGNVLAASPVSIVSNNFFGSGFFTNASNKLKFINNTIFANGGNVLDGGSLEEFSNNIIQIAPNYTIGALQMYANWGNSLSSNNNYNIYSGDTLAVYNRIRLFDPTAKFERVIFPNELSPNHAQYCGLTAPLNASVPTDFNGTTRLSTTLKGALQNNQVNNDGGVIAMLTSNVAIENIPTPLKVRVRNNGLNTITSVTLRYSLNGGAPIEQTFATNLSNCDTTSLTFSTPATFTLGATPVKFYTQQINGIADANVLNDTLNTTVFTGMNGTYSVNPFGSGDRNFLSFIDANTALQIRGVVAPVIFNLANTVFVGDTIKQINGSSATNTITFQNASNDSTLSTITGIRFDNAKHIIVRKVKVENSIFDANFLYVNKCQNITVTNCQSIRPSSTWGIQTTRTHFYNDNTLQDSALYILNNRIEGGSYGMYFYAYAATGAEYPTTHFKDTRVNGNEFWNMPTGMHLSSTTGGTQVIGNLFRNITHTGISMNANSLITYQDSFVITKNTFRNFSGSLGTYPNNYYNAIHIAIDGFSSKKGLIANNMIHTTSTGYAIACSGNVDVVHNNILAVNNNTPISIPATINSFKNNIIQTRTSTYSGSSLGLGAGTNINWDYNTYYQTNLTGVEHTNAKNNFNTYKAGGKEPNTIFADPRYYADTNLHVNQLALMGTGTPISFITDDIDNESRSLSFPDRGADEFDITSSDGGVVAIVSPNVFTSFPSGNNPVMVNIKNFGAANLTTAIINWSVNGVAQTPFNFSGNVPWDNITTTPLTIGNYNFAIGVNYSIKAWISLPNGVIDPIATNDTTITTNIFASLNGTYTLGGTTPDFTSFTHLSSTLSFAGIFSASTINVRDGIYNDTLRIGKLNGSSATKNLIIQSENLDSSKVKLQYTYTGFSDKNWLIRLDSTDHLIFNKLSFECRNSNNNSINIFSITSNTDSLLINNCWFRTPNGNVVQQNNPFTNTNIRHFKFVNNFIKLSNKVVELNGYNTSVNKNIIIQNNLIDSASSGNGNVFNFNIADSVYIQNNVIQNFVGSPTYAFQVTGYLNTSKLIINKNQLKNLNGGYGIFLQNCLGTVGSPLEVYNNMISSRAGTNGNNGLYLSNCSYVNIYHNTIANRGTFNVYNNLLFQSFSNINIRNNIFVNTTNGAPNIKFNTTTFNGLVCNNNIFYTNGANEIFTTANSTLANWQTTYSQDINSFKGTLPVFVSSTDAHIVPVSTIANNKGVALATVTTDIDSDSRSTTTPDCGADEYTPFVNEVGGLRFVNPTTPFAAGVRNVDVKIVNGGTANLTTATINWSVNGVAQTAYNFTGNLSTGDSSTITLGNYNFNNFNGDSIVVIATLPNGMADPYAINDTIAVKRFPALSGVYTIGGVSPDFINIRASANALSRGGQTSTVIFNIRNGIYIGTDTIANVAGNSAINTITYQSEANDSSAVTLTKTCDLLGGIAGANLSFINTKYVTIRKLSFVLDKGLYGCNPFYNKMIHVSNTATSPTGKMVFESNNFNIASGSNNDYITITANYDSLYFNKNKLDSTGVLLAGNVIYANYNNISYGNVLATATRVTLISNIVDSGRINTYSSSNLTDSCFVQNNIIKKTPSTLTYSLEVSNFKKGNVFQNKISNAYCASGLNILTQNATGTLLAVHNNFVHVIGANNTTQVTGLNVSTNSPTNIFFNSVNVTNTNVNSSALNVGNANNGIQIRNNSLAINGGYALYRNNAFALASDSCNYNNYYTTGANLAYFNFGVRTNLAALKTVTGRDAKSISATPIYLSATDLHSSSPDMYQAGIAISGITKDIDDENRHATNPCIGADEYNFSTTNIVRMISINSHALEVQTPASPTSAVTFKFRNNSGTTLTNANFKLRVNGVEVNTLNWTGSLNNGDTSALVTAGNFDFRVDSVYDITVYNVTAGDLVFADDTLKVLNKWAALNGSYTVAGATPNFRSLQRMVRNLENGGLLGNVVMNIRNGVYTDSLTFNSYKGSNLFTLTVQAESGDSSKVVIKPLPISNISGTYFVKLFKAQNLFLQKLTFYDSTANFYATNFTGTLSFVGGLKNVTIQNCELRGSSYNILNSQYSTAPDTNLVIKNNWLRNSVSGVLLRGENCTGFCSNSTNFAGFVFANNRITNITNDVGFSFQNGVQPIISNNYIESGMSVSTSSSVSIVGNKIIYAAKANSGYGMMGINLNRLTIDGLLYNKIVNNAIILNGNYKPVNAEIIAIKGINISQSAFTNIYHNTISIRNADTSSVALAVAASSNSTTNQFDIKNNNIIANGVICTNLQTNAVTNSNYNNYYYPHGKFSATHLSLNNFKIAFPSLEINSLTVNPIMISNNGYKPASLELNNMGIAIAGIATDIDEVTRGSNPDIGCVEFAPLPNDASLTRLVSPAPLFPVGTNSVSIMVRNTGTNALTRAKINWSVSNVLQTPYYYTSNIPSNDSAVVVIGNYNFPLNNNNALRIWVDTVNNVLDIVNANDTLDRNLCWAGLNGTYVLNATTGDFRFLSQVKNQLLNGGVFSTSTVNIAPGSYSDDFYITRLVKGLSPSVKLTIQSQNGDSSSVVINTLGYGYLLGLPYTTLKKLTFKNQNIAQSNLLSLGNNTRVFKIENCIFQGGIPANGTTSDNNNHWAIGFYYYTGSQFGDNRDSIEIRNCKFINSGKAIDGSGFWNGGTGTNFAKGLIIENNQFINNRLSAITIREFDSAIIRNNYIVADSTVNSNYRGIAATNPFNAIQVYNNQIYVKGDGVGIEMYHSAAPSIHTALYGAKRVYNNMVKIGDTSRTNIGINIYGGGFGVLHNSVHNTSNKAASVAVQALGPATSTTGLSGSGNRFINNSFYSNQGLAIKMLSPTGIYFSNYNNLFTNGPVLGEHYNVSFPNLTQPFTSFNDWKTGTSSDGLSVSSNPFYFSATNLHTQSGALNGRGTPMTESWLANDIDGDLRNYGTPDIGADEFNAPNMGIVSIQKPMSGCDNSASEQVRVWVKNFGSTAHSFTPIQYQFNGGAIQTDTINSTIKVGDSLLYTFKTTVDMSTIGIYSLRAWTNILNDSTYANDTSKIRTLYTTPVVNTFPYRQGFESSNGNWFADGDNCSWQYGVPAATFIKSAATGTKAWVTNLTGPHNNNENSYLYTPCFDFNSFTKNPFLAFNLAYKIEPNNDSAWVEISEDGENWRKVLAGTQNGNWYNNANNVWDSDTAGWKGAFTQIDLATITNKSKVRFRFAFKSNATVREDGFGIDDFLLADTIPTFSGGVVLGARLGSTGSGNWITSTFGGSRIISINDNGNILGDIYVNVTANSNTPAGTYNGTPLLSRSWVIKPTNQPTTPVLIRIFFTNAEFDSLKAKDPTITSINQLSITKYTGANEDFNLSNNTAGSTTVIPAGSITYVPYGDGWFAEFSVTSFSEFYVSKGSLVTTVNTKQLIINAKAIGNNSEINWQLNYDEQVANYEVQRSTTALNFITINSLISKNKNGMFEYSFNDANAFALNNTLYYRVKTILKTGEVNFSQIVKVNKINAPQLQLVAFPNPFVNNIILNINMPNINENATIQAFDANGKQQYIQTYKLRGGINNVNINTSKWAKGNYIFILNTKSGTKTIATVKL